MLRLFKQGSFILQWFIIAVLYALPIVLLNDDLPCEQSSPLSICQWFSSNQLSLTILRAILGFLVVVSASLLLRMARLITFNSFLASLITVMLIQIIRPEGLSFDECLASLLLFLAILQLFRRPERGEGLQEIFISSALLSTAGLAHPVFGLSIIVAFIYLLIFRSYLWRQWIAVPVGFSVPHLFILMYYFWFDRLPDLMTYYQGFIPHVDDISSLFQGWWMFSLPPLALAVLYAILATLLHQSDKKIQVRAQLSMFVLLLAFAVILIFIYVSDNLFALILPLTWLLTLRIMESRSMRSANVIVILLTLFYAASILNLVLGVA